MRQTNYNLTHHIDDNSMDGKNGRWLFHGQDINQEYIMEMWLYQNFERFMSVSPVAEKITASGIGHICFSAQSFD